MGVVDHVKMELGGRMGKVELLRNVIILLDLCCSLNPGVFLHAIYPVLKVMTKMQSIVHPREINSIQLHFLENSWLLKKGKTFSLALGRIYIGGELQVMFPCI